MERARVVLVTNVGHGFGRAVALAYGRAGYDVVCADRDVDLASKTAAELEELDGQAIPIQADMTTQMDVLAAYEKVMEIFGALGGVVHLASHVSTTPFENLAEGEFLELLAENVRSSYLVLKTAARLRSVDWVVVVAPPTYQSVQMLAVQGALSQMVEGFRQRFAAPRANLILPSRSPSDPRHDQALVRAVRYFGSPESTGVGGQVVTVELPAAPSHSEALLPEVRAALDPSTRQDEGSYWQAGATDGDDDGRYGAESSGGEFAYAGSDLGRELLFLEPQAPSRRGASGSADERDLERPGYLPGDTGAGAIALDSAASLGGYDDGEEYEAEDDHLPEEEESDPFDLHWSREYGLPRGAPALRHLIADDAALYPPGDNYAAGVKSARDLYGDLSRLEGTDLGEFHAIVDYDAEAEEDGDERPSVLPEGGRRRP